MKIKTVSYKRIKNLGNYQSETVEMMSELDDDDVVTASKQLKEKVLTVLELNEITENSNPF